MVPAPLPTNPRMELTEADAAALERGGLALEPLDVPGPDDPIMKTVATYASLLASSLTVSQVAHILGVSTGRVRQELYAGRSTASKRRAGGACRAGSSPMTSRGYCRGYGACFRISTAASTPWQSIRGLPRPIQT